MLLPIALIFAALLAAGLLGSLWQYCNSKEKPLSYDDETNYCLLAFVLIIISIGSTPLSLSGTYQYGLSNLADETDLPIDTPCQTRFPVQSCATYLAFIRVADGQVTAYRLNSSPPPLFSVSLTSDGVTFSPIDDMPSPPTSAISNEIQLDTDVSLVSPDSQ